MAFIDAGTSHPFHSKSAFSRQGITAVASGGYIESSFSCKRIGIGFAYRCIGTTRKGKSYYTILRSKPDTFKDFCFFQHLSTFENHFRTLKLFLQSKLCNEI